MTEYHRIRPARLLLVLPALALLGALGCVEDEYWIDRVSIVLEAPTNRAVVLAHDIQEGNIAYRESPMINDDTGLTLAEIDGNGQHTIELLTVTPDQRDSVLFIVWADDPDCGSVGLPDCEEGCEEDGTRIEPSLDYETSFTFPSAEYPLSWCGGLLGS